MKKYMFRNRRNRILLILLFVGALLGGSLLFYARDWYASQNGLTETSLLKEDLPPSSKNEDSIPPKLVINEVCGENLGYYMDGLQIFSDYVELYNAGETPICLDGFYLSDDAQAPLKCPLPSDVTLEAGSCLLIYAEKDKSLLPDSAICVDFQIKPGEDLILSQKHLTLTALSLPELLPGTSYSRTTDGIGDFAQMWMSPGLSNSTASFPLTAPVLSLESGFYEEGSTLEITSDGHTRIYYTLDGGLPDETSFLYQGPLTLSDASLQENVLALRTDISSMEHSYTPPEEPVDKGMILRAIAIDDAGNYSPVVSAIYFVGFDSKPGYENIPILSLITTPESLLDQEQGIYILGSSYENGLSAGEISPDSSWSDLIGYTNYSQKGASYERNAHFDFFSSDRSLLLSQEGGIRIRGNHSRDFAQKSFSLYSRDRYGFASFLPVFFDSGVSYSTLTLNGSYNLAKTLIGSLVSDRSIAVQKYEPCQVFLNGEYWGLYDLMEKYDSAYIEAYYGVDANNVLMIESTYEVAEGDPEDLSLFRNLRSLLETDMSHMPNYRLAESQMDMQSLIDWLCTNIYVGNTDTKPLGGNVFTWRSLRVGSKPYEDGRWRWMLYDTDDSFGAGMDISPENPAWAIDSFTDHPGYSSAGFLDDAPMTALMANEEFRQRFVLTFLDMANENFRAENVSDRLDTILALQPSWAAKSMERWDASHTYDPSSFLEECEFIRDFFLHRFDSIVPCLAEHFDLTGELVSLTLSSEEAAAGSVKLNTICPALENGSWTGRYYTDYPVTLTAVPAEGYVFTGWELSGGTLTDGSLTSPSISVRLEEGDSTAIKAIFEKETALKES